MLHRYVLTFVVFFINFLAMPPCSAGSDQPIAHRMVAVLPLSGSLAVIGTPKREAMELALEQVRRTYPNLKLSIEYQDSQAKVANAISVLYQVVSANPPDSLFIDMTTIVDASVPILDNKKILTFAGSAQAGITKRSEYLYRIFPGGDQEVQVIVSHLRERKAKRIFVLHANELYGKSIKDALLKYNAKLPFVGFEEFAISDKDFRTQLAKARDSGADVVAVFGYGNEYGTLLRQAQELGIPSNKIVANIGAVNIGVTQLPAGLTEGMVFAAPTFALRSGTAGVPEHQQQLETAYQAKYGKAPDFRVAFIYDTIMLLAAELHKGATGNALRAALRNVTSYQGASGTINITSSRDASVSIVLGRYQSGKPIAISALK